MEFRQINYFIALFEEGTVTRAAHRLNIVQPALSMQIGKLEELLGQQLFERTKQGIVPTAAARTRATTVPESCRRGWQLANREAPARAIG